MDIQKTCSNVKSYTLSVTVLFGLIGILSYASILPAQSNGTERQQYAVVFPPSTPQIEIFNTVIKAQGLPVRNTTFDFIMVVASTDKNFQENIQKLGAIFVFSPIIKGSCVTKSYQRFRRN